MNRSIALIILIVLILASTPIAISQEDELERLYKSWIEGNPLVLVRLDVKIPKVDADECLVVVARFPTPLAPTEYGRLEYLYTGSVSPDSTITVKKYIPAIPVKLKYDEVSRSYTVKYYEPQEFILIVNCVKGKEEVLVFNRGISVYPKSLLNRVEVDIAKLMEASGFNTQERPITYEEVVSKDWSIITSEDANMRDIGEGGGGTGNQICSMTIVEQRPDYKRGECRAWVKGPYLYSLSGLNTSFCFVHYPRPSAMYLTYFAGVSYLGNPPSLNPAGKKITAATFSGCSSQLTGNSRVRVYLYVKFVYEEILMCGNYFCREVGILYPSAIRDVGTWLEPSEVYLPPQTRPHCADGPSVGDRIQPFLEDYEIREGDSPISSISITFSLPGNIVSLNVELYNAGRNDNQYTTPYVNITDVSGKTYGWYYRWFKYCDPMTYELQFGT